MQDYGLKLYFWAEATQTACYIINRVSIRLIIKKTPCELFWMQKPSVAHLRPFGCKCYILNTCENINSANARSDEGIFVGYSLVDKVYRVYVLRTRSIQEHKNVEFVELKSATKHVVVESDQIAEDLENLKLIEENSVEQAKLPNGTTSEAPSTNVLPKEWKFARDHPKEQVIGDPAEGVRTRGNLSSNFALFDENFLPIS